jgi:hypothetical protein
MLPRFRHQLYLLGLFLLGAAIPLGGILLLLAAGLLMFGSITGLVVGAFLLSNGIYGLVVSFKSFKRPEGRTLDVSNAPELMERLDDLARAWKGPRRADVVLDPGFWGLDLVGVPTLGLLGWPRFTWLLGLNPLMALSEREFEVLASWELIWWCDQQGWLNLQVKRLSMYWNRLNNTLQEPETVKGALKDRWSRAFLRPFARWAKGRFEPFLLGELLRTDLAVAAHYGGGILARALCRQALLKPLLDARVFAPWDRDLKAGKPLPEHPTIEMRERLAKWPEGAEGLLQLALDGFVPEAPPLLRLRLDHLGEAPAVPLPSTSPAVHLLDGGSVVMDLDREWAGRMQQLAEDSARSREALDRRFHGLRATLAIGFPHHPDARDYMELALDRLEPEEQVKLVTTYLQAYPSAEIRMHWLRAKLANGEEIHEDVRELLAVNPFVEFRIHGLFEEAELRKNDAAKAEAEWLQARRGEVIEERARKERRSVGLRDELEPHGLCVEDVEAIHRVLSTHASVREAFLVRKHVEHFPESPVYFLVVRWKAPFWDPKGMKRAAFQAKLASDCPFPAGCAAFVLVTHGAHLRRKRRKLNALEAQIFAR